METAWQSAQSEFLPLVGKSAQGLVAAFLVLSGLSLTGVFYINESNLRALPIAVMASLCLGLGSVYLMCAVGVYV